MTSRLWLLAATLLILPALALGYGRLGGFDRSHQPQASLSSEPGAIEADVPSVTDPGICPVCAADGRTREVDRDESPSHAHEGRRYHLCSGGCLQQFKKNPAYFLAALAERWHGTGATNESEEEM